MNVSEAKLTANRQNALKSCGPRTEEGKAISRANALKHGMTGEGIALSNEDSAEVERRFAAMNEEMQPSGEMSKALVRRMATLTVRLDRSVLQESAAITERVRQVEADFEAPEGVDEARADQLRAEAGRRAMFDPSREATLARKYEAAAERGLFKALKEFRQVEKEAKAGFEIAGPGEASKALGSFMPVESILSILDSLPAANPSKPAQTAPIAAFSAPISAFEVPITIGRGR
jgi:hypothetical protein